MSKTKEEKAADKKRKKAFRKVEEQEKMLAKKFRAQRERAIQSMSAGTMLIPPRTCEVLRSLDDVKKHFAPPLTLGYPKDGKEREKLAEACDRAGYYDAIYNTLTQHASDLGQYPVTSFIGYGVLQQIAQNGMIRSCISTVSDDITREWLTIIGGDKSDGETVDMLNDLQETKYHLKKVFHDAIDLTGYMGGCFIFIDTGCDEEDLELPLAINVKSAELGKDTPLRFIVVDPINCAPVEYNSTDPLRKDYMQPKSWWVLGKKVHASRLIPVVDNRPPQLLLPNYNFLGIPQAQILWDYVIHWNSCRVATANLLTKISLLVYKTNMSSLMSDPNGIATLDQKMTALQRYRDNDAVFVVDKDEEDVANIQTSMAGCTDVVRQSLEMIAAINRTPAVKLLGISPSGFNATGQSDITNYYDYIKSKQELRRDAILKCLKAIQIVEFGELDDSISVKFNELGVDREAQNAMSAQSIAGTLTQLASIQAISAEEVREAVKKSPIMGLDWLSDDAPDAEPDDMFNEFGGLSEKGDLLQNQPTPLAPQSSESAANPPDESRQLIQGMNSNDSKSEDDSSH